MMMNVQTECEEIDGLTENLEKRDLWSKNFVFMEI